MRAAVGSTFGVGLKVSPEYTLPTEGRGTASFTLRMGCRGVEGSSVGYHRGPLTSLAKYLGGARLIALNKRDGGIRPVAVGCTLRRITSRILSFKVKNAAEKLLSPTQVGVAVSGGAEAIIESVKSLNNAHRDDKDFVIFQADFRNAFNTVSRASFVDAVDTHLPKLSSWIRWCYESRAELLVASDDLTSPHILLSEEGCQQGDPLGPLLFCLAIRDLTGEITNLENPLHLNAWFFDDGTIAGNTAAVLQAIRIIEDRGKDLGLSLNHSKSVLYWPAYSRGRDIDDRPDPFPLSFMRSTTGVRSLGAPIGNDDFTSGFLTNNTLEKSREALERLKLVDNTQVAFSLLRNCAGLCRINYLARAMDCESTDEIARKFDALSFETLEGILGGFIPEPSREQARLPIRLGGLGLRNPLDHLGAARLASVNSNRDLVQQILENCGRDSLPEHSNIDSPLEYLAQSLRTSSDELKELENEKVQKKLSNLVDNATLENLVNTTMPVSRARILACNNKMGTTVLFSPGVRALGTILNNQEFRTFLAYRIGLPVLSEKGKPCPLCRTSMDATGYHASMCHSGSTLNERHNAVRNAIYRICQNAAWSPVLEKEIIVGNTRLIPGDVFLPQDTTGAEATAIDVTVTNPLQSSLVLQASKKAGVAAETAEKKKRDKHFKQCRDAGVLFKPFGIEFFGTLGATAQELVDKMAVAIAARRANRTNPCLGEVYRRIYFPLVRAQAKAVLVRANPEMVLPPRPNNRNNK